MRRYHTFLVALDDVADELIICLVRMVKVGGITIWKRCSPIRVCEVHKG